MWGIVGINVLNEQLGHNISWLAIVEGMQIKGPICIIVKGPSTYLGDNGHGN